MNTLIALRLVLVPSAIVLVTFPLWRRYVLKPNPKAADPIVFWGVIGIATILLVIVGVTELSRYTDRLMASVGRANPNPETYLIPEEETEPWPTIPAPPIALPLPPPTIQIIGGPPSRWWSCSS